MIGFTASAQLFYVIADPIAHVRASDVFNAFFAKRGLNAVCVPLHVRANNLAQVVGSFRGMENVKGMFISIPHKEGCAGLCDALGTAALRLGVVNVIRRNKDGTLSGDNFDGAGFVSGLLDKGYYLSDLKRWLMLGAGGAARSIAFELADQGATSITIRNRNSKAAARLKGQLSDEFPNIKVYTQAFDGKKLKDEFDAVVNCTSLGLKPKDKHPLDLALLKGFSSKLLVCDIIMQPPETKWLASAGKMGFQTHGGMHMFEQQCNKLWEFLQLPAPLPVK